MQGFLFASRIISETIRIQLQGEKWNEEKIAYFGISWRNVIGDGECILFRGESSCLYFYRQES